MFHARWVLETHLFWGQKVKGKGHESQKLSAWVLALLWVLASISFIIDFVPMAKTAGVLDTCRNRCFRCYCSRRSSSTCKSVVIINFDDHQWQCTRIAASYHRCTRLYYGTRPVTPTDANVSSMSSATGRLIAECGRSSRGLSIRRRLKVRAEIKPKMPMPKQQNLSSRINEAENYISLVDCIIIIYYYARRQHIQKLYIHSIKYIIIRQNIQKHTHFI